MKMLVVRLDDDLDAQLARLANQRARTKSAFVRETLRQVLSAPAVANGSAYELMLGGIGSVRSGLKDLASNPRHLKGFGK
jgi:plasmid stability protein